MAMCKPDCRNRLIRRLLLFLFVVGLAAGGGYLWAKPAFDPLKPLEHAEHVTLYALFPGIPENEHLLDMIMGEERFGGYEIRAKNEVSNPVTARRYCQMLHDAMRGANPKAMAMCFNPRHGLRIHTPLGPVDYVICFECSTVLVGRSPMLLPYPLYTRSDDGTLDMRFLPHMDF